MGSHAALVAKLEEAKEGSREKIACPQCHGLGEIWAYPGQVDFCTNPECRDGFLKAVEAKDG